MLRFLVILMLLLTLTSCTRIQITDGANEDISVSGVDGQGEEEADKNRDDDDVADVNASDETESIHESGDPFGDNKTGINIGKMNYDLNGLFFYEDLKDLTINEWVILKNAIYASKGYIFKTQENTQLFSQYSWYKPVYDDVQSLLSECDKMNLNLILKLEGKGDTLYDVLDDQEKLLIGFWQKGEPSVGSGYCDAYEFDTDRTFIFTENEMNGEERLRALYGSWYTLNEKLYLHIVSRDVIIGGELESTSEGYDIKGGILTHEQLSAPYVEAYSLSFDQKSLDYGDDFFGVLMNDDEFYHLGEERY